MQLGSTSQFLEKRTLRTSSYSRTGERHIKTQALLDRIIKTRICLHTRVVREKLFGLMHSLKAELSHIKDKLAQPLQILLVGWHVNFLLFESALEAKIINISIGGKPSFHLSLVTYCL